jgi:hypothetical protein
MYCSSASRPSVRSLGSVIVAASGWGIVTGLECRMNRSRSGHGVTWGSGCPVRRAVDIRPDATHQLPKLNERRSRRTDDGENVALEVGIEEA